MYCKSRFYYQILQRKIVWQQSLFSMLSTTLLQMLPQLCVLFEGHMKIVKHKLKENQNSDIRKKKANTHYEKYHMNNIQQRNLCLTENCNLNQRQNISSSQQSLLRMQDNHPIYLRWIFISVTGPTSEFLRGI